MRNQTGVHKKHRSMRDRRRRETCKKKKKNMREPVKVRVFVITGHGDQRDDEITRGVAGHSLFTLAVAKATGIGGNG